MAGMVRMAEWREVSAKEHQGVSLLPRCLKEEYHSGSKLKQLGSGSKLKELGSALCRVANRLYKINHFFPKPDFAKELLLAVSSRFITCKHEQKDMCKVLPLHNGDGNSNSGDNAFNNQQMPQLAIECGGG